MWCENYQNLVCRFKISPPYFLLVIFVFVTNLYCCFQKAISSEKIEFDSNLYVSMLWCKISGLNMNQQMYSQEVIF